VLASLGVASAQVLLACGAPGKQVRRRTTDVHPELRTWLHDAVAVLRGAGFSSVHVLAASRQRITGAVDVLGAGVARSRCDGLVLTVRDRDGMIREQVGNDLSREGIEAAVKLLAGDAKPVAVSFGAAPAPFATLKSDPDVMSDGQILAKVGALAMRDRELSSRIVYSAALLDLDDARVWSVAPGRDLQQRILRVRKSVTRVAWNGTRPIVSEAARAWTGTIDDQDLDDDELVAAREGALALMTPRAFEDKEYGFALEPAVTAAVIDAVVHALLTTSAARRPEVAARAAIGAKLMSPLISVTDDPSVAGAYGGFRFDDAGEPPAALTLIDRGQVAGRINRALRAGHVGRVQPAASHVRIAAGTGEQDQLLDNGFLLEGPLGVVVDPASDRVVIAVARARERVSGKRTGRMFAEIELVGDLSKIMTSVTAISKQTKTIGIRDEIDGQPRWRSIEAPWLRGTALLRARRRAT
jgi:predicted Zn-dependent protease